MQRITERQKIKSVLTRWKEHYEGQYNIYPEKKEITRLLSKLDLNVATTEQISAIIGNDGWTTSFCSECEKKVTEVICIGQEPDYESETVWLCRSCVEKAYVLMCEKGVE